MDDLDTWIIKVLQKEGPEGMILYLKEHLERKPDIDTEEEHKALLARALRNIALACDVNL